MSVSSSRFTPLVDADAACGDCRPGMPLGFDFSFAYQPVVDIVERRAVAHEALVRGPRGEGAGTVLSQVNAGNRYRFDQACRVKAIKTAAALGLRQRLSINFLPNAVYKPELCIRTTIEAARTHGFPLERIVFEVTEGERVEDGPWFAEILREYKRCGFLTAIDDFGAGYAGLRLLADFQPDIVKIDMDLIRAVDTDRPRQAIVSHLVRLCQDLGIAIVAEGIETPAERDCLADLGIRLMQGYLFARPAFQGIAEVGADVWPARTR